jgi:beta-lactamase regulating signal transducer with metallopeptidase domain
MNWGFWTQSEIVTDLGWALLHSTWQISLITAALFVVLRVTRAEATRLRYVVCVTAMALALIVPLGTYWQYASFSTDVDRDVAAVTGTSRRDPAERANSVESEIRSETSAGVTATGTEGQPAWADYVARAGEMVERTAPTLMPGAVAVWLFGMLLFGIRLGGGFWQVHRYRTFGVEPVEGELFDKFELMCDRLGISGRVELVKSTIIGTPVAFGILKPIVLLPASIFLQMSPREIELIVAHELTHIRRYDPLVNIFQSFAEVVLFYHPGIWWISCEIRREREFATDRLVTETEGVPHAVYAAALVNLEEIRVRANYDTPRLATAADGGKLMQRVKRILQKKTEMRETRSAWPAGVALLLISAVVAMAFSTGSTPVVNADAKKNGRKLAIGFVSLPPVDRTENAPKDSDATARLLIEKLKNRRIPATGFVLGGAIEASEGKLAPIRANIVRMWRDAGFEVGIGGYKHIWFAETPINDYIANVEKNERLVAPLLAEKGQSLRYFSYPFLNTGRTHDDYVQFEKWLAGRGLQSIRYTLDNQEWMYSYAYDMARNENDLNSMNEIRDSFIKYMGQMFDHFETYSTRMFGRDIAQTMVLTPSRLVADSSDELFGMIEKRGYSYVPMAEAQADPAYQTEESFAGKSGISWFERWAMHKKQPLLDEPKVSKQVWDAWELRKKEPPKVIMVVKPN